MNADFLMRLTVDTVCVTALIRGIYYRRYQRSDLFLTYFSFNLVIFLIAYLLNRVEMTLGAAFGLFAVFSMLRYRTEGISAKDMTYLFLVIAVGLIMSIGGGGFVELSLLGGFILLFTWVLEGTWLVRRERSQSVVYENISLIGSEHRQALIDDPRSRTGLAVHRVEVHEIDYLRKAAHLVVYHYES